MAFIWPVLIANEGMQATVAIQIYLRSLPQAPPHLVGQMCNLVHTLANTLAICKTKGVKDGVAFEAVVPLLTVLSEMQTYVVAKSVGKSAQQTASIVDEVNRVQNHQTPLERVLSKERKKNFSKKSSMQHKRFQQRRDFGRRRQDYDDDDDE